MSKIALTPNASGSGTFTIAAPNSDTDRTLTLPDEAGTVVTTAGADFTDQVTATKTSAGASTNALVVRNLDNTAGTAASIGFAPHGSGTETHRLECAVDGANSYSMRFYTYQSGLNERMRIDASGNVGIGTTNPSRPLDVHKTGSGSCAFVDDSGTVASNHTTLDVRFDGTGSPATGATYIRFGDQDSNNGSITVNGGSVAYNTSSDYRKKENIVDLTDGIDRVKQLDVHRFNWIGRGETVDGFIAHEVQTVVPEAVTGTHNEVDDDGNPVYQGIDQSKLVPLLTAALQEAIAKIETLETTVADLQTRVTALEATP